MIPCHDIVQTEIVMPAGPLTQRGNLMTSLVSSVKMAKVVQTLVIQVVQNLRVRLISQLQANQGTSQIQMNTAPIDGLIVNILVLPQHW